MKSERRLPYMPWFPRDFLSATRGWPVTAKGVYRELLDASWDCGGGLPADTDTLRRMIGATAAEWRTAWPLVEPKLPITDGDGLRRNARLEYHRAKAMGLSEVRSDIGYKGGKATAEARRRAAGASE